MAGPVTALAAGRSGGGLWPPAIAATRFIALTGSRGMSLPMIGKLLGHTQVQTTQRYAHLYDDPLRAGLNQVGDMLRPKLRIVSPPAPGAPE